MDKLYRANIKIIPKKCQWISEKIRLLGHIVSGTGIEMDPTKIEAIKLRKPPTNIKQVQQFLGLCNYYRKFIKDFANITVPLYNLLKNDTKWEWREECQTAFGTLVDKLTSYPVLRQPAMNKELYLRMHQMTLWERC